MNLSHSQVRNSQSRLGSFLVWLNSLLHIFAAIWLFLLTLVILADVLGRGVFNSPLPGTAEIVANSVVAIAFLQLNHSISMGGMLRAEFLDAYLPGALVEFFKTSGYVLGCLLFLLVAWGAWNPMVEAWLIGEFAGNEGSIKLPTYPVRTLLVAMCLLAAVNYAFIAFQSLKNRSGIK
jgi:TRAP-type C4-dicarboxylate transport system permease small subunit